MNSSDKNIYNQVYDVNIYDYSKTLTDNLQLYMPMNSQDKYVYTKKSGGTGYLLKLDPEINYLEWNNSSTKDYIKINGKTGNFKLKKGI